MEFLEKHLLPQQRVELQHSVGMALTAAWWHFWSCTYCTCASDPEASFGLDWLTFSHLLSYKTAIYNAKLAKYCSAFSSNPSTSVRRMFLPGFEQETDSPSFHLPLEWTTFVQWQLSDCKKENCRNCSLLFCVLQLSTMICTCTEHFLHLTVGVGLGLLFNVFF